MFGYDSIWGNTLPRYVIFLSKYSELKGNNCMVTASAV